MARLDASLNLRRGWDYPGCPRPAAYLPVVYGDHHPGGSGGVWTAQALDAGHLVYALAGHPLAADGAPPILYDGDGREIPAAGYALNLAHDYLGLGAIATVSFAQGQKDSEPLTVRGRGRPGADGALLENPLAVARDLLIAWGGLAPAELHATSWARAQARAAALGYRAAGVIQRDWPAAQSLTELLGCFLGSWWRDGAGLVKVVLDWGPGSAEEAELALGLAESALQGGVVSASLDDLVNRAPALYAHNPAAGEYQEGLDGLDYQDRASQGLYGARCQTLELPWVRHAATARAIAARLVGICAWPRRQIDCTLLGSAGLALERGDACLLSLHWLRDRQGAPLVNQIARVLSLEPRLDQGTVALRLLDSGYCKTVAWLADGRDLADGSRQAGGQRDTTPY